MSLGFAKAWLLIVTVSNNFAANTHDSNPMKAGKTVVFRARYGKRKLPNDVDTEEKKEIKKAYQTQK